MIQKKAGLVFSCVIAVLLVLVLGGCATNQGAKQEEAVKAPEPVFVPLKSGYGEIFVMEIDASPDLKKEYGEPIKECRSVLISSLLTKNKYRRVEAGNSGDRYNRKTALLVRLKLNDMRIASFGSRFWGGAWAGNSFMNMHMTLVDALTKKIVREEDFNSGNSAWAAAWNFGASDRSLPSDMGMLMAEYIEKVVPAK
jgi:hypothetical protein